MKVIDLFAGCGGLSLGFLKGGFTVEKAVEFDPVIANTYKMNHPNIDLIVDDIKNVDISKVFKRGEADVIVGGPPCQGFSMAGARIRQGFIGDPRNYLFKHYFNIVKVVKPKVFVMENVKGLLTMENGKIIEEIKRIFRDPKMLDGNPYHLFDRIIRTTDFGIPQKRERLIIIGTTLKRGYLGSALKEGYFEILWERTRNDILSKFPSFFDSVTIYDAIGNLPVVTKDGLINNPAPQTEYEKYISCESKTIENHLQSKHSKRAVERMKRVSNGENYNALDEKINSVHSGSYGRLCWDEQAATITTRFDTPAGGRFIHPVENRTLSPREAARIQSFPDDFVFSGDKRSISRQIGNAVPPKVSFFLARLVKNILAEEQIDN
jgi:DNA (cytosine-5)-methyltransferase 1